ncbi:MAG: TrlF family AAA-like ATPase, partial [Bacteroidia bacterium]
DENGLNIQFGYAKNLNKVRFDFEAIISSLKKFNLYENKCLVWLPYDEYGGIDDIDPNDNFFKLSLVKKAHIMGSSSKKQIDFFKWKDENYTKEQFEAWFEKCKPCIKGSDAHEINYPLGFLKNQNSEPTDKHCWINADTTFQGLRQIIVEPERVFIGDEPDLLKRVRANQTKFIKGLGIKKIENSGEIEDVWFDNFKIELNSSLVAIIGNKGGGKSAIADVIGLCGNTHRDPSEFSFLTDKKFRKQKPYNLSNKFEASLVWHDGSVANIMLNENPDKGQPERVKYIPQNFLERLCVNVDSDDFEKELRHIIFSHTPAEMRLGKSSLDELINYKSSLVIDEIAQLQTALSKLNLSIITLEDKTTKEYKRSIENKLKLKQEELNALNNNKPIKPVEIEQSEEAKVLIEELAKSRESIVKLQEEIEEHKKTRSELTLQFEELNRTLNYFKNLNEQLNKNHDVSNEYSIILARNNIALKDVFTFLISTDPISNILEDVKKSIKLLDDILDVNNILSKPFKVKQLQDSLVKGQEELDKPAKEQQKYLDELKKWEDQKKTIEGNNNEEGTLSYYNGQLNYISNILTQELEAKIKEREKLTNELYTKKIKLLEVRKELYQPVTKFIDEFKELKAKYDVKIDVALELRSFPDSFFNLINQSKGGTFYGKQDGYKILMDIIEKAHFENATGFIEFTNVIMDSLKYDKRTTDNIVLDTNSQLKKGVELSQLYDYIFGAEYLQPVFNLKLGSKTLQELSPGERGALLLIFYLILDKDDIPLIIDQPEENLDNESIYHILVHFIKKVKEKRQIIIVTHNPNLAIVCDADQIIQMKIDKENKNTVEFYSGAIEDKKTNEVVVNILEGTLPAFNNRDSKYVR